MMRIVLPWIGSITATELCIVVVYLAILGLFYFIQLEFNVPGNVQTAPPLGGTVLPGLVMPWNRALGHVCTLQLAILLLPVSRNSVWVLLGSRFYFDRAIRLHRFAGRFFYVTVSVHGAAWFIHWFQGGNVAKNLGVKYHYFGLIAWIAMTIMLTFAAETVRRRVFEVFYYLHHLFVVVIVSVFVHVYYALREGSSAKALRWKIDAWWYCLPAIIFYTVDRSRRAWSSRVPTELIALYDSDPLDDVTRLEFERDERTPCNTPERLPFKYAPGQYVFIRAPVLSLFQWHPFTLSSSPISTERTGKFEVHALNMGRNSWSGNLYHRAQGQMRSMLFEEGKLTFDGFLEMNVDGPYGGLPVDLRGRDGLFLVAGGIGITPMMSLLRYFADAVKYPDQVSSDASMLALDSVKRIHLCWVVRSETYLLWFKELEAISSALGSASVAFSFSRYVTSRSSRDSKDLRMDKRPLLTMGSTATSLPEGVATGRPNIVEELSDFAQLLQQDRSRNAVEVFVCGPASLIHSTHSAALTNRKMNPYADIRVSDHGFFL